MTQPQGKHRFGAHWRQTHHIFETGPTNTVPTKLGKIDTEK